MKVKEGIVQIIARQNWSQPAITEGVPVKDEIWGLSNYGRLFQFNTATGDWVLKGSELES